MPYTHTLSDSKEPINSLDEQHSEPHTDLGDLPPSTHTIDIHKAAPKRRSAPKVSRIEVRGFVEAFYEQARQDPMLGPVFDRIVAADQWDTHFETMTDFWLSVAFDGPTFRGNPMIKHARIKDIAPHHFDRWLEIFDETCCICWPPDIADLLRWRARQISPSLMNGVVRAREKQLVTAQDMR